MLQPVLSRSVIYIPGPKDLLDEPLSSGKANHMNAYNAVGSFTIQKQNYLKREQPFSIQLAAKDDADATHKVFSTIGSRHSVTRRQITIHKIVLLKDDEVTDLVVKKLVGDAK
jgi:large subunit ribosomal protein LX